MSARGLRRGSTALALAAAVGFAAGAAFAQENTAQTEHGAQHGSSEHGAQQGSSEHGSSEHGSSEHGSSEHGTSPHGSGEHAATEHAPDSQHGETGEHGQGAHDPHAGHVVQPMNWTQFGAPPRRDAHGVERPAPPPFAANLINFAIVIVLLYMALTRVINPALASRRAAVESDIGEAQRLRAEAEAMHREYTEKLARLDDEIDQMRREFREAGESEKDRIVHDAREKADRMQKDAEVAIQQEMRQLRDDILRETVEAAVASAEQAVRKAIAPNDQTRLVDDYLVSLEKRRNEAAS